ncbi:uncharacterized protein LOC144449356 [Glandiceps talaboti]
MPRRCVVGGCSNTNEGGFKLHKWPKDPQIASLWTKFVQNTRAFWKPTQWSHVCSAHFEEDCYHTTEVARACGYPPRLREDSFPTINMLNSPMPLNSLSFFPKYAISKTRKIPRLDVGGQVSETESSETDSSSNFSSLDVLASTAVCVLNDGNNSLTPYMTSVSRKRKLADVVPSFSKRNRNRGIGVDAGHTSLSGEDEHLPENGDTLVDIARPEHSTDCYNTLVDRARSENTLIDSARCEHLVESDNTLVASTRSEPLIKSYNTLVDSTRSEHLTESGNTSINIARAEHLNKSAYTSVDSARPEHLTESDNTLIGSVKSDDKTEAGNTLIDRARTDTVLQANSNLPAIGLLQKMSLEFLLESTDSASVTGEKKKMMTHHQSSAT